MYRSILTISLAALLASCGGKPKSLSPEETVMSFAKAMADKKPGAVWELLPASYQTDVNSVVAAAASKADPDLHSKGSELFSKLVGVLKNKKQLILGVPMLQQIPNVDTGKLTANYDAVVAILETIKGSDLSNLEALKKADVGKFLSGPGTAIATQIATVAESFGGDEVKTKLAAFNSAQAKVKTANDTSATLELTLDGKTKTVDFVKVEDRWVPAEMAKDWPTQMTAAKDGIAKTDPAANKLQVLTMMGGITAVLDQLDKAQTQDEFNQMLASGLGPMMGGMQ